MTEETGDLVPLRPGRDQSVGQPPAQASDIADTSAVSLSGGGYRAMLYHLGFVWRMRDAGLLRDIDNFASVSGGSITAGMLAVAWTSLDWDDDGASFRKLVAAPIMDLSGQSIDVIGGLIGRIPGMGGTWVRRAYDKHLYKGKRLAELPSKPRFTFNATSLHSGKLVRINQDYFADWSTGRWDVGDMTVATAVTASSAFPPVLSPIVVDLSAHRPIATSGTIYKPPPKLFLMDGGVYDNLGIESVWKRNRTVYVSDAGASFNYSPDGAYLLSKQALRTTFIMQDQIGALRFRQMLNGFAAHSEADDYRKGFLVSSDYFIRPRPAGGIEFAEAKARAIAATRTCLSKFEPELSKQLVNWGYIATDDRLRTSGLATGTCKLPYPECPLS
jgi:NTE family protein